MIIKNHPCTQSTWINQKYRFQCRTISLRREADSKKESKTSRVNHHRYMAEMLPPIRLKPLFNQSINQSIRSKERNHISLYFHFSVLFYKEVGLVLNHFNVIYAWCMFRHKMEIRRYCYSHGGGGGCNLLLCMYDFKLLHMFFLYMGFIVWLDLIILSKCGLLLQYPLSMCYM